jgi:endonuclease YncB( thermonuclease family)
MPEAGVLTESSYQKLVVDIRKIIAEGRTRAQKAAAEELVKTYWEVGRRICQEGLTQRAGYAEAILEDLADELRIDHSTLLRCIHFFQTYKTLPSAKSITWSHYKVLLPLNNAEKRKWYERLIQEEGLTAAQLAIAVKKGRFEESQKRKGKETKFQRIKRPVEATYVYKALVERVIDGDTLLLRIDLGFQVWKQQRIRLAGIDAPAIDTPKGRKVYEYLREQMAKLTFVMVKTHKIDIYGRYVGHIFYSFKRQQKDKIFTEGRYLNQELVEQGLARVI